MAARAQRTGATQGGVRATVPGIDESTATQIIERMQERLVALLDLQLTLKHVHWNVVGINFIAVHEMLDPQVDAVRGMADEVAERIATMGGEPLGTPGAIVSIRAWDDYELRREPAVRHLAALDEVYTGVVEDHRSAIEFFGQHDPMTEDLFIGHTRQLELFQWFVRAHLKDSEGDVVFRRTDADTRQAQPTGPKRGNGAPASNGRATTGRGKAPARS